MKMSCKYRPWLNAIAACFLLVASTQAQEEAFDVDDSIIPQRPPSHIFDPAKWLSPDEEDSIQLQLAKQYKDRCARPSLNSLNHKIINLNDSLFWSQSNRFSASLVSRIGVFQFS